jgi:hypothetical protein
MRISWSIGSKTSPAGSGREEAPMFGTNFSAIARAAKAAARIAAAGTVGMAALAGLPSAAAPPTRLYRAAHFRGCRE